MNKLGVGQITMSGREHIVTVGPVDKGLVMEVLRYAEEIKSPNPYFHDLPSLKLDAEMVSLARELVAKKAAPFQPEAYKDSYAVAMRELVEQKAKGQRVIARPSNEAPQGKVVDLLDALRSSLKQKPANSNEAPKPKARKKGGQA